MRRTRRAANMSYKELEKWSMRPKKREIQITNVTKHRLTTNDTKKGTKQTIQGRPGRQTNMRNNLLNLAIEDT